MYIFKGATGCSSLYLFNPPFCSSLSGLDSSARSSIRIFCNLDARENSRRFLKLGGGKSRFIYDLDFCCQTCLTAVVRKEGHRSLWNNKLSQTSDVLFSKVLRTFGNGNRKQYFYPSTSDSQQSASFPCIMVTEKPGKSGRVPNVRERKYAERVGKKAGISSERKEMVENLSVYTGAV